MKLTQDQLLAILQTALSSFREELDSDITAARILTLLTAVKSPGIPQAEIVNFVKGLSQSAVSRNVLDLSDLGSSKAANGLPLPGPDFLTQKPDPAYRKRNLVYPTPKGLSFLNRLTEQTNQRLGRMERH